MMKNEKCDFQGSLVRTTAIITMAKIFLHGPLITTPPSIITKQPLSGKISFYKDVPWDSLGFVLKLLYTLSLTVIKEGGYKQ